MIRGDEGEEEEEEKEEEERQTEGLHDGEMEGHPRNGEPKGKWYKIQWKRRVIIINKIEVKDWLSIFLGQFIHLRLKLA